MSIDIPRFRYIDDVKRFLDKLDKSIDESGKVLTQQQKLLASTFARMVRAGADVEFDITPSDRKDQLRTIRKMKTKIDPNLVKVVVPNFKKLESQYNLAEDLYEKHKAVETVETTLSLAFPNRRGEQYEATMAQIQTMKAKIAEQLKICLQFLSDVADKHVPKDFKKYTATIAELIDEYVIFKTSHQFLYVSVTKEGDLAFTSYLLLQDVANDEGYVTPHLYISVQWILSKEPTIAVDLNHEYEVPNKLVGQGEEVGSVGEAVKAISTMLELENFSSALGVVPLALQLKVDPTELRPELFSYRDLISKVGADENTRTIWFKLRKEANTPELKTEIGAQLYKELKQVMKSKNVRMSMRWEKDMLMFKLVNVGQGGEFSAYDFEWLRDKFGLSNQAMRKIDNIINSQSSQAKAEKRLTPQSNDLAELTQRNHQQNLRDDRNRRREE